jgi:hypothetical protein
MRVRPHLTTLWKTDDPEQSFLYVVCLEATFLHARALVEFLVGRPNGRGPTGRKRPPSDIGANLLLPEWDDDLTRVDVAELDAFCHKLDGALAHLSKRRIQPEMQMEVWVPDINRLYRGLFKYQRALDAAGSAVAAPLLNALNQAGGPISLSDLLSGD